MPFWRNKTSSKNSQEKNIYEKENSGDNSSKIKTNVPTEPKNIDPSVEKQNEVDEDIIINRVVNNSI